MVIIIIIRNIIRKIFFIIFNKLKIYKYKYFYKLN